MICVEPLQLECSKMDVICFCYNEQWGIQQWQLQHGMTEEESGQEKRFVVI